MDGIKTGLLALVIIGISLAVVDTDRPQKRQSRRPTSVRRVARPSKTPAQEPKAVNQLKQRLEQMQGRLDKLAQRDAKPAVVSRLEQLTGKDNPVTALTALQDALDQLAQQTDLSKPTAGQRVYGKVLILNQIGDLLDRNAPLERRLAPDVLSLVVLRLEELIRGSTVMPRMKGYMLGAVISRGEQLSDRTKRFVADQLLYSPAADAMTIAFAVASLNQSDLEHPDIVRSMVKLVREDKIMGDPKSDHQIRSQAYKYLSLRRARHEIGLDDLGRFVKASKHRRDQSR